MIHSLTCSFCDGEIHEFEKYLSIGEEIMCEYCVESNMEEYDPEGNLADIYYDQRIERTSCDDYE